MTNYSLRVSLHYMLYGESVATTRQHALETVVPLVFVIGVALAVTDVSMVRVRWCSFKLCLPTPCSTTGTIPKCV
jgi:hypothetical protein